MSTKKVCPFCGSKDVVVERFKLRSAWMECRGCGAAGPRIERIGQMSEGDLLHAAGRAWDKRAA
jgi:ribosomal protein L37AE/L43A